MPPTGAKRLHSAITDVTLLAAGLIDRYAGEDARLAGYGDAALGNQRRAVMSEDHKFVQAP